MPSVLPLGKVDKATARRCRHYCLKCVLLCAPLHSRVLGGPAKKPPASLSRGGSGQRSYGGSTMRGRTLKLSMAVLTAALAASLAVSLAACGGDDTAASGSGAPR